MNWNLKVPFGYGTQYVTLAELQVWLLNHHHPEFVRRFIPWLETKGGVVGVGGGWRKQQPAKPGFAPSGKSFHQNQVFNDGFVGAVAVDVVKRDGPDGNHTHDSVSWSDVPKQGTSEARRWGVHANTDTEAWHVQPIEVDGWTSWKSAGRPAPKAGYPIPGSGGTPPPDPPPLPVGPPVAPPILKIGSTGRNVQQLQSFLGIKADGEFGPMTDAALRAYQRDNGLTVDGIYGPKTYAYASGKQGEPIPPGVHHPEMSTPPGDPQLYRGINLLERVRWLQAVLGLEQTGVFDAVTEAAVKSFQANTGLTADGRYGQQTATELAEYRGR